MFDLEPLFEVNFFDLEPFVRWFSSFKHGPCSRSKILTSEHVQRPKMLTSNMDVGGVCWRGGCVSVGCVGGLWVRMVGFVCMVVWFEVVYGWDLGPSMPACDRGGPPLYSYGYS